MATAVAAWPSTINVTNFSDYSENWDTNFAEFAPDVGPPKRRRRMSLSSETLSPVMYLTTAEVETFRAFYRDTLKDGTLPFTFPKPRTGVIEQYTFSGQAPQVKFADYGLYQVSMTWRSVPNTRASWLPLLTVTNALIPSLAPDMFADFTTEGSTDPHYWYLGNRYASFATWLAAMGGTFVRSGSVATYFKSGLLQAPIAASIPRFPTDASGVPTGLRCTSNEVEMCLWNRDLTNGAWSINNVTRAKTQIGIDGVANSATLVTATAANGAIGQTTTNTSASYNLGVWVKRITGTGTILLSIDGGTTTTAIVPTAVWQFFLISAVQTLANPQPLIKIVTSGDAIAVDFVSLRNAITPISDPIATTTATVAKGADVLSFPYTNVTFSLFAKTININTQNGFFGRVISFNDPGESGLFANFSPKAFGWYNGTATQAGPTIASFSTSHKSMAAGTDSLFTGLITTDGATPVLFNAAWNPVFHNKMFIGTDSGGNGAMDGDLQQFAHWDGTVASSADLVRLTT